MNRYLAHDNSIELEDQTEVFIISKDFWNIFASRYHADMVVQVRKYDSIREMVKQPMMEGEIYVAFKPDLAAHYEPMIAKLNSLSLDERC